MTGGARPWLALQEATALVTAHVNKLGDFRLSGEVPAEDVADALAAMCAGLLRAHYPGDHGAGFLRQTGAGALNPEGDP